MLEDIFDIPIKTQSLTKDLLRQFCNKKIFDIRNEYYNETNDDPYSFSNTPKPEQIKFNNYFNEWQVIGSILQHPEHFYNCFKPQKSNDEMNQWLLTLNLPSHKQLSLNQHIKCFSEMIKQPGCILIVVDGFNKHGEKWIKELKIEYTKIYHFVNFNPLDAMKIYNEQMIKIDTQSIQISDINDGLNEQMVKIDVQSIQIAGLGDCLNEQMVKIDTQSFKISDISDCLNEQMVKIDVQSIQIVDISDGLKEQMVKICTIDDKIDTQSVQIVDISDKFNEYEQFFNKKFIQLENKIKELSEHNKQLSYRLSVFEDSSPPEPPIILF